MLCVYVQQGKVSRCVFFCFVSFENFSYGVFVQPALLVPSEIFPMACLVQFLLLYDVVRLRVLSMADRALYHTHTERVKGQSFSFFYNNAQEHYRTKSTYIPRRSTWLELNGPAEQTDMIIYIETADIQKSTRSKDSRRKATTQFDNHSRFPCLMLKTFVSEMMVRPVYSKPHPSSNQEVR